MALTHAHTLFETPALVISRFEHGADPIPLRAEEERCDHYCVNFVESGEFGLSAGRRFWHLRRGNAFVWHPEVVHSYVHFAGAQADTCLTVRFRGAAEAEIAREGWLAHAVAVPVPQGSDRLGFLRWRLDPILQRRDALELEAWSMELVGAVLERPPAHRYAESQLPRHADRIEMARRGILARPDEPHTLLSLSSSARLSPFHFARVFRSLVGTPPHRFLRDVRLDRARSMLLDGESVTITCYATGFGNLSHFIRSFRQRFGMTPSRVRKKTQARHRRRDR
jgi:AraC-like DNA-binding protein